MRGLHSPVAFILLAAVVAMVIEGCGDDGSPAPEHEADYFPYSVGSTWTYVYTDSTGVQEPDTLFVSVVKDTLVAQARAAKLLFESHWEGPSGPGEPPNIILVKSYRLVTREGDWVNFYANLGYLSFQRYKLPLTEGATWELEHPSSDWSISYEVLAPVDVSVPAGDFSACVPVRRTEHELGNTDTDTEYFADGIGLVKRLSECGYGEILIAYHIH